MINRARLVKSVLRTNYYQKYGLPRNATDQARLLFRFRGSEFHCRQTLIDPVRLNFHHFQDFTQVDQDFDPQ